MRGTRNGALWMTAVVFWAGHASALTAVAAEAPVRLAISEAVSIAAAVVHELIRRAKRQAQRTAELRSVLRRGRELGHAEVSARGG